MRRVLASLAVLGVVLAGCGNEGSRPSSSAAPPATASANGEAPEALQLTAPLVGGGTIDLAQYAGTTVALWFWAPT
ncbi:MAG: hypothetical protein Q7V57_19795 [Actinomycetota bacterium]|nr:hypothetical protein [Actinomycetota bacterium]